MTFKLQVTIEGRTHEETICCEVASFERETLDPETLGLTLNEGKTILKALQEMVAEQQVNAHLSETRNCLVCGEMRRIKGNHDTVFRTVFGKLTLQSPRWHHCDCQPQKTKTFSPLAERLPERTTPELLYLEAKWASLISYGMAARLIKDVLPVDDKLSAMSVKNHLHRIAQRSEAMLGEEQTSYIEGCPAEWAELPTPDGPLTIGVDGGYVRSTVKGKWFEVVAGKSILSFKRSDDSRDENLTNPSEATEPTSKCFAFVHTYDEKSRRRVYDVLSSQGLQNNQQVTFLSDGGETLKGLKAFLSPEAEYLLDWFHITMRLTVLKQTAKGLPEAGMELVGGRSKTLEKLERIKHYLWHGNAYRALEQLRWLEGDFETLASNDEERPTTTVKNLHKYLSELHTYLKNNRHSIPNYGERYRNGERISTGFVESAVNQVVAKRFSKKQSMRWTKRGAHLLLQMRTKVLNDDLDDLFRQWYPSFCSNGIPEKLAA